MHKVPYDIWTRYDAFLKAEVKDVQHHENLRKWFLYFWDFRDKYHPPNSRSEQVRLFIEKLQNKGQSQVQQKHAAHAVSLYFQMRDAETKAPTISTDSHYPAAEEGSPQEKVSDSATAPISPHFQDMHQPHPITEKGLAFPRQSSGSRYREWRCLEKSGSPAWDKVISDLSNEIKTRHYSPKTLKAYADWIRKFQGFLHDKLPEELSETDVKEYLTYLAVECTVAASTQNQAFNALLFLYRHILKKDFGNHKDIPRAKESKYIPVVLSRREIDAVLKHLSYPYDLVVKLLYGCGLRLLECLKLRVQNFNFDEGMLSIQQTDRSQRRGNDCKVLCSPLPRKSQKSC